MQTVARNNGRAISIGPERRLVYPLGPRGQQTWLVDLGADGKVARVTQALTDARFDAMKEGEWTRERVLTDFGPPAEVAPLPLRKVEVWSYRYRQSGVYDSMMHVYFDQQGIVRQFHPGMDLTMDPGDRRGD